MSHESVIQAEAAANVVDLRRGLGAERAREIAPEDWARLTGYVGEIFEALGMDLATPGTRDTPRRFLEAMREATAGYDGDPKLSIAFPAEGRGGPESALAQIVEGPISFHALCEHHALPFHGIAYLGYVADESIIGISKLTRIVRLFARRFTVQERVGEEIADALWDLVEPHGVAVHLTAEHLCTHMRGVGEPSSTVTTVWRGSYLDADLRREFLDEVRSRPRAATA